MDPSFKKPDTALKLLNDHSPIASLLTNREGKILYANPATYHLFGYTKESIQKIPFRSFFKHTKTWQAFLSFMVGTSPTLHIHETELVRYEGTPFFADVTFTRVEGSSQPIFAAFIRDITQFYNLLQEKKKNETLLSEILNAVVDGLSLLDQNLNIVRANTWIERMYKQHGPLVGKKCYNVYQDRATPCPWCPSLRALKTGIPHREIVPYPSERSPKKWLELSAYPARNTSGDITGVVEYVRDITREKKLRERLVESEKKYRGFFENLDVCAYRTTNDGRILDINPAGLRLLGYTREEVRQLRVSDIYEYPVERQRFINDIEKRGAVYDYPVRLRRKDGSIRSCHVTAVLIRDQNGHSIGQQGIIRDITEQEKREEQLYLLHTLFMQTDAEIVITDFNGSIEYVNPAFERITGYSAKEAKGQNPRILKSGKQDEAFYKDMWETITGGKPWSGRFINKRKDGTIYHEDAHIFPIFNKEGNIIHFAAIKRDITHEVALESQLQQASKLEAIGQLVGGIAHDFNNILTVILGLTDLGLSKIPSDHPLSESLMEIHSSAEQATRIIQQLLGFSRKQMISPELITGNEIIDEITPLLQRYIGEDIKLVKNLTEEQAIILADRSQIEQCLLNLVINARDAIWEKKEKNGEKTITIETYTAIIDDIYLQTHVGIKKGHYFVITVNDTGVGMDQETLSRIFDPFFTTKPEGKGTGLGCSTVFGIVKQNMGAIYTYSEVGIGTTIKIYWPLADKLPVTPYKKGYKKGEKRESLENVTGEKTLLIVEDDASIRKLVRQALESAGYRVFEAENGKQALSLVKEGNLSPDLLFTDIIMPGITGEELARLLHEQIPTLKVLFTSGYTENHIFKDSTLKQDFQFLHKPYTIRDLIEKIRAVLDKKD